MCSPPFAAQAAYPQVITRKGQAGPEQGRQEIEAAHRQPAPAAHVHRVNPAAQRPGFPGIAIQARFKEEVQATAKKPKAAAPKQLRQTDDMFAPETPARRDTAPLIPDESGRPEGQTPSGISESVIRMEDCSKEQLLEIFKMTLGPEDLAELEGNPKELNDRFDMLCLKEAGEPWASIKDNPASRKVLVEALENRLRMQKQSGGRR